MFSCQFTWTNKTNLKLILPVYNACFSNGSFLQNNSLTLVVLYFYETKFALKDIFFLRNSAIFNLDGWVDYYLLTCWISVSLPVSSTFFLDYMHYILDYIHLILSALYYVCLSNTFEFFYMFSRCDKMFLLYYGISNIYYCMICPSQIFLRSYISYVTFYTNSPLRYWSKFYKFTSEFFPWFVVIFL